MALVSARADSILRGEPADRVTCCERDIEAFIGVKALLGEKPLVLAHEFSCLALLKNRLTWGNYFYSATAREPPTRFPQRCGTGAEMTMSPGGKMVQNQRSSFNSLIAFSLRIFCLSAADIPGVSSTKRTGSAGPMSNG